MVQKLDQGIFGCLPLLCFQLDVVLELLIEAFDHGVNSVVCLLPDLADGVKTQLGGATFTSTESLFWTLSNSTISLSASNLEYSLQLACSPWITN